MSIWRHNQPQPLCVSNFNHFVPYPSRKSLWNLIIRFVNFKRLCRNVLSIYAKSLGTLQFWYLFVNTLNGFFLFVFFMFCLFARNRYELLSSIFFQPTRSCMFFLYLKTIIVTKSHLLCIRLFSKLSTNVLFYFN